MTSQVLLEPKVGPVFLDVDNAMSLNKLVKEVMKSKVLVVLQTKDVMKRPWCILEMYTAVKHKIPIVTVNIQGRGYDFKEMDIFLNNLDSLLDDEAKKVLRKNQCKDIKDVAYRLGSVIPNSLSIKYDPAGSENAFNATIDKIRKTMELSEFVPPTQTYEQWLELRPRVP